MVFMGRRRDLQPSVLPQVVEGYLLSIEALVGNEKLDLRKKRYTEAQL